MFFHVVSNEGINIQIVPSVRINLGKLINLGQVLQKTLFIKERLYIFLELSKDTGLEKCLHGKTQNAKESFNGAIWDSIPKNTLVTLPNLEFGRYNGVAHCILE